MRSYRSLRFFYGKRHRLICVTSFQLPPNGIFGIKWKVDVRGYWVTEAKITLKRLGWIELYEASGDVDVMPPIYQV